MTDPESQIYTGSEQDREAELKWLHERKPPAVSLELREGDAKALEVISEYKEHMPALLEALKKISFDMSVRRKEVDEMNAQLFEELQERGMPEEQALLEAKGFHDTKLKDMYEKLREKLTESLAEASALSMEMSAIGDGVKGTAGEFASPEVRQEARAVMDAMDATIREIELAFNTSITRHNEWTRENTNKFFGKRNEDYDKFKKRKLTAEFYNERVGSLMEQVAAIEEDSDKMKHPTADDIAALLLRLDEIYISKFGELNDQALPGVVAHSREAKMLIDMIDKLRATIAEKAKTPAEAVTAPEELGELEPLLEPQEYNAEVEKLSKSVEEWENIADKLAASGKLTKEVRADILDELRAYPEQLLMLDERTEKPETSDHRAALIDLLKDFRSRLQDEFYVSGRRNPEIVDVSVVRDMYHKVRASYASVQHSLTIEQRRDIRARIASLASLVRRAEDERGVAVHAAILAAVSHATEHAPAIAHAAVVRLK